MYRLNTILDPEFPEFRTVEFTGYKNKKFVNELEERGIPFDGSFYMYRVDNPTFFDGWQIFNDLLQTSFMGQEYVLEPFGWDPRARESLRWRLATQEQINKIKGLLHIFGMREHVTFAQIISVPRDEEKDK